MLVVRREVVPVGDDVEVLEFVLELHPVLESSDEVPQMELSGRTHS